MNHDYRDIRSRIGEPPLWFDECAVPRYVEFEPKHLSNIYAHEAALILIACQDCGTKFKVAFSNSSMDEVLARMDNREPRSLADTIRDDTIHYGDPPNIGCCAAGPTMNCDDLHVLEYWRKEDFKWKRDKSLEIALERGEAAQP